MLLKECSLVFSEVVEVSGERRCRVSSQEVQEGFSNAPSLLPQVLLLFLPKVGRCCGRRWPDAQSVNARKKVRSFAIFEALGEKTLSEVRF